MKRLFTIGYEGAMLEDFLATLSKANIDVLLESGKYPSPGAKVSLKQPCRPLWPGSISVTATRSN